MKKALITGITGQDGSYLTELLLYKNYEVHGLLRRNSVLNFNPIQHIHTQEQNRIILHYADLSDTGMISDIIWNIKPDEVYHLGAQSNVRISFDMPEVTGNITGLGTTRILEAVQRIGGCRFYQASSSEMFGDAPPPQNEQTMFYPKSPYAAAKLYAHWMTINFRECYHLFACNGILFNHESPRRGETFVTRKITSSLAKILLGQQKKLYLGNLDSKRDWGFAPEYVEAMWLMLQQDTPNDYVVGTGVSHTVREFLEHAFHYAGIELEWHGKGVDEKGVVRSVASIWEDNIQPGMMLIEIDPRYFRPAEGNHLCANINKAKRMLNWQPRVTFQELIEIMADYDMKLVGIQPPGQGEAISKSKGFLYTNHQVIITMHQES